MKILYIAFILFLCFSTLFGMKISNKVHSRVVERNRAKVGNRNRVGNRARGGFVKSVAKNVGKAALGAFDSAANSILN